MMMGGHIDTILILSARIDKGQAALFCQYIATNAGVTVNGRNLIVVRLMNGRWLFDRHMTVVKD